MNFFQRSPSFPCASSKNKKHSLQQLAITLPTIELHSQRSTSLALLAVCYGVDYCTTTNGTMSRWLLIRPLYRTTATTEQRNASKEERGGSERPVKRRKRRKMKRKTKNRSEQPHIDSKRRRKTKKSKTRNTPRRKTTIWR